MYEKSGKFTKHIKGRRVPASLNGEALDATAL